MKKNSQELTNLVSIGPKIATFLNLLGISRVAQLKGADALRLYERLCAKKGVRVDICCLDVFSAAIAQAKDPNLSKEKKNWWYWSRIRLKVQGKSELPRAEARGFRNT